MLCAFSVTPLGTGDSVGDLVADAVRIVRESGLPNQTDAMFTLVEGEWDAERGVVICPRHGATFDICSGRALTLPAYIPVDTFPVRVDDGIVKVDVS